MNISAFFPAYNEEGNIRKLIKEAKQVLGKLTTKYEIIIVLYDASTDKTRDIVKELSKKDKRIRLVIQPKNKKGYGTALRIGYKAARYEWVFYTDSDNQYDLQKDLPRFVAQTNKYKFVTGHRKNRQDPVQRLFTAWVYNMMMRIAFFMTIADVDCAFNLIHKDVLKKIDLKSKTGIIDTEIIVKAKKEGFEIKQLSVKSLERYAGESVFESRSSFPKPKVVIDLLNELWVLFKEVYF